MRMAKSAAELGFKWYDRRRLTNALKPIGDARSYRRLRAVFLVASGRVSQEVAQIIGVSFQSVYNWVNWYLQDHSVDSLFDRPRSGRPIVAQRITDARIKRELGRDPLRLGYNTTIWTVPLLAQHLSRLYDCPITARTLRRRMKQIGLRWKRPRHGYSQKEPHLPQKKGLSSGV